MLWAGLSRLGEPDTSLESGGLYDKHPVGVVIGGRRAWWLGTWALDPALSLICQLCMSLGSTASLSLNFLILKLGTKIAPSCWRWCGDGVT